MDGASLRGPFDPEALVPLVTSLRSLCPYKTRSYQAKEEGWGIPVISKSGPPQERGDWGWRAFPCPWKHHMGSFAESPRPPWAFCNPPSFSGTGDRAEGLVHAGLVSDSSTEWQLQPRGVSRARQGPQSLLSVFVGTRAQALSLIAASEFPW